MRYVLEEFTPELRRRWTAKASFLRVGDAIDYFLAISKPGRYRLVDVLCREDVFDKEKRNVSTK